MTGLRAQVVDASRPDVDPVQVTKKRLDRSLARQFQILRASVILTPVDSIPLTSGSGDRTHFLHGLYASDKLRTDEQKKQSGIQFAGRDRITSDINRIHRDFAYRLGAEAASLRLLSGLHAHVTLAMSLAAAGDRVLLLPEAAGGHFAIKGILERLGLKIVEMVVDTQALCIDSKATLEKIRCQRPQLVLVDRSEGLKYEDFSWLEEVACGKIFDASHYLPQIMSGEFRNPFDWGFDLQVFSLHKSFPGPQKAGAAARQQDSPIWRQYLDGVGAFVSSSHIENSYAAGYALADWSRFSRYTELLSPTAVLLESALLTRGAPVVSSALQGSSHWPHTHHIWIQCEDQQAAYSAWQALEKARIQTNYRKLPYNLGWGLRLGTTAAVMRGLTAEAVEHLADLIVAVLRDPASTQHRHAVRVLAERMNQSAIVVW